MSKRTQRVLRNRSTYFLAALLGVFFAGICARQVGAASQSVTVANAMVKIHPTDAPPTAISAEIHAAQNEFEAFQLVVSGPATGVSVTAPTLTGPNGATIPGSEVRLYREGYQNITTPSNTEGGTGLWPDALIPDVDETANEKRNAFPFDVPSGQNRVVWVEVHVPQGQSPGTYQGSAIVAGSGLNVSVPVTLVVWDFSLPSTSSLASTFGMGWSASCTAFYGSYNACGGDAGVEKMHTMVARFMLDHRITANVIYNGPSNCTGLNCDWTHFDATYGALFDGTDPNSRLKGAKQTTILYVWNTTASSYYAGWAQHFKQKGWFDRTYDYTCDEPPNGCGWSAIPTRAAIVHGGDPSFRTLTTASIQDADKNGVTSSVNILSPVVNFFNDKSGYSSPYQGNQRPNYNAFLQHNPNNKVWWYQSCMSDGCGGIGGAYFSGWPSFMVDNTSSQNRSQGMLSWLYNVSGVLYYTIDDKLSSAWSSVYDFGGNGDGTLLYPGTPSVIGGTTNVPVASIRLKMIREGFEDYEYMKLVSDLGDPNFATQTGQTLYPNIYQSIQSPDAVYAAREALANRILALKGLPPTPITPPTPGTPPPPGTPPAPTETVTRIEETAAAVTYTGTWFNNGGSFNSGSSAKLSLNANSSATVAFNGTGVSWIGYQDEWSGIADVFLDGTLKAEIDTYASPSKAQSTIYSVSGLANGAHKLTITVTGRKGASSSSAWVWVDAFDVASGSGSPTGSPPNGSPPGPTGSQNRVEQSSPAVIWTGAWAVNKGTFNSGGSAKLAMTAGSRATFTFTGTHVSWIAFRDEWSGIARVYIDGTLAATVDTYLNPAQAKTVAYTSPTLPNGNHTIAIEAVGTKNSTSGGSWVWVDAFDYVGAALTSAVSAPDASAGVAFAGGSTLTSSGGLPLPSVASASVANSGGTAPSGMALISYKENGVIATEAGVPASAPISRGRILAETSSSVNTGFAVANPNDSEATVSFYFTDSSGTDSRSGSLKIPAHGQVARFLNESPFNGTQSIGTFTFSSDFPVSAIALRGRTNERSEFLLTTLPVANPDQVSTATAFFPHYADGGGWKTQFVLLNPTDNTITGTLGLIGQTGETLGSVPYQISPRSYWQYSTSNSDPALHVASAQATGDPASPAPEGTAIISYQRNGIIVSEAGVPAIQTGNAFRLFFESTASGDVRTGVGIVNTSESTTTARFDLVRLDGSSTGLTGTLSVPAFGQRALFLDQTPGFETLPKPFKGFVRITTSDNSDLAIVGLRGRVNARSDFLVTTTPPVNENSVVNGTPIFPQVVDGGGFTTQFVLYGPNNGLDLRGQNGARINLTLQ